MKLEKGTVYLDKSTNNMYRVSTEDNTKFQRMNSQNLDLVDIESVITNDFVLTHNVYVER